MNRFLGIAVDCLGQSGFRFQLGETSVYIDPYLSDRVAANHGNDFSRMIAPPYTADAAPNADWILITHIHDDHCDPDTLGPLAAACPRAKIVGPAEVITYLQQLGFDGRTLLTAEEQWLDVAPDVRVRAVPAAHTEPERDEDGRLRFVGYVLEYAGGRVYHSGDTAPHGAVRESLRRLLPIDIALLPVNERNFYRDRRGIIGNMSVREAFQMATDLGVATLVPMHWDLFAPNSVFREELQLLYDLLRPPFRMVLQPEKL